MALAGLVGAGASLIVGRFIDLGHARAGCFVSYGAGAFVIVLKAASLAQPWPWRSRPTRWPTVAGLLLGRR